MTSVVVWILLGVAAWAVLGTLAAVLLGRMVRHRDRQVPRDVPRDVPTVPRDVPTVPREVPHDITDTVPGPRDAADRPSVRSSDGPGAGGRGPQTLG